MGAHNHQRTNVAAGAGLRTPVSCAGLVRGRHTLAAARSLNLRVRSDVDRGRTVPTGCVGGAGNGLRGEGRRCSRCGGFYTGRGERYIFRLLIQFRISVMLRTLLLCSCQYVLVLVLCWFCESAGPELVTKSGAVHPGGVAEFVLRIKRRLRCVPRFPFFPSPPLEASEGTPSLWFVAVISN